jgi:hypothetical protein
MGNARLSAIRERYMQDELPTRLGGLATNLMRIASVANHIGSRQVVDKLLEESKFFIEWTAPDATLDKQTALVELQIKLARWHYGWHRDSADQAKRAHLAQEARTWAERVLEMSDLLTEREKQT